MRCVELLQKYEKQTCNLQFRILSGKALIASNNSQQAIRILEREPSPDERPDESVASANHALRSQKNQFAHMQAERFQLLAKAYESIEDKQLVVHYLQEALVADC